MMPRSNNYNNKRMTTLKAMACTFSLVTSGAMGFTSSSSSSSSSSTIPSFRPARPLHIKESRNTITNTGSPVHKNPLYMAGVHSQTLSSSSMSAASSEPRLTRDEEQELLRQAAELRRLNQLEADMAVRGQLPLLSIRAKAAGYGDDLEAYEDAKFDGQKAREVLVTRNMGLVQYCVTQILHKKKHLNSLSRDDLVQEGAIGLARAVDKYNLAIGGKFSTYAVYWIRAAVLRCIAEKDDLLRVPSHVSQAVHEINKAAKRLGMDHLDGTSSYLTSKSWQEAHEAKRLAEEAGLSERNFEEAMKVRHRRYTGGYVAFESWMQKGENLVSDVPVTGTTTDSALASMEREQLRKALSKFLRPKEMEALSWRYGLVNDVANNTKGSTTPQQRASQYLAEAEEQLFGESSNIRSMDPSSLPAKGRFGEAMSFHEVGKKMKVSAEYGRKLCHAGLAKLRQAAEEGRLEPALLF